ncbi:MAG: hypothetical protein O2798_01085 [Chloroflexi bacterium]|nr:hypothetical protein [Chloroflexota bacterium]MDA1239415.1 hypothetical protein [Chloroflexota bacterium]
MAEQKPKYEIRVVADRVEEDPDVAEMVSRMEAEADAEIAASSVTLRWGKAQVDVVKRAAGILGVPYQTYLKQVVFKQALEDIARAEGVLGRETPSRPRRVAEDGP